MGDISQLPEHVIHNTLSFLETKEALRASIFCKKWYSAWLTCPTLAFSDSGYALQLQYGSKLFQFMGTIFERYQDQKIHIEHMNMCFTFSDSLVASNFSRWITIAVQNGVTGLDLNLHMEGGYTLPRTIFEGNSPKGNSLRQISFRGYIDKLKMEQPVKNNVMFQHLQKLSFIEVHIDDDMFQGIISGCPLIEYLCVKNCEGLNRIEVTNLRNLNEFIVCSLSNQIVKIEGSSLQYLDCDLQCGSLDLYNIEKLKYITLAGHEKLLSTVLENLKHKAPQVEDLRLAFLYDPTRINILSDSLKHIVLESNKNFSELKIDAPYMVSLELKSITFFPEFSITNAPREWELKISTWHNFHLDSNQFLKLKLILSKSIGSKISLYLGSYFTSEDIDLRKIPISHMVEVEDVEFSLNEAKTPSNFIDAFLTFHPKALIVSGYYNDVSVLYANLIRRKNQGCHIEYLTTDCEIKTLYQELREVKFRVLDGMQKSSLDAQKHYWRVCFTLEWEIKYI